MNSNRSWTSLFFQPSADIAQLERLRDRRLRNLIAHAARHSDHYRTTWERTGIRPQTISGADDLPALPVMDKHALLASYRSIIRRGTDTLNCAIEKSSGTTGESLQIPSTPGELRFKHALWFSHYTAAGLRPWHRQAKFMRGDLARKKTWAFQRGGIFRRDHFPVAAPTTEKIRWLREKNPDAVFAWGSVLNEIALHLERAGETLYVPLVFSSSDTVLHDLVAQRFGARLVEMYGAMETGPIGRACTTGRGFHIDPRWNIVEILDDRDRPATSGRIVVTVLWRTTFPLLRYAIGDRGAWSSAPCPCGDPRPLLTSLDGFPAVLIELAGGGNINGGAMAEQLLGIPGIRQYQLVQTAPSEIVMHIVPAPDFPDAGAEQFLANIRRAFGDRIRARVRIADSVYRAPGSKVCSDISLAYLQQLKARGIDIAPFLG